MSCDSEAFSAILGAAKSFGLAGEILRLTRFPAGRAIV
jgi:hypothetical protein